MSARRYSAAAQPAVRGRTGPDDDRRAFDRPGPRGLAASERRSRPVRSL